MKKQVYVQCFSALYCESKSPEHWTKGNCTQHDKPCLIRYRFRQWVIRKPQLTPIGLYWQMCQDCWRWSGRVDIVCMVSLRKQPLPSENTLPRVNWWVAERLYISEFTVGCQTPGLQRALFRVAVLVALKGTTCSLTYTHTGVDFLDCGIVWVFPEDGRGGIH